MEMKQEKTYRLAIFIQKKEFVPTRYELNSKKEQKNSQDRSILACIFYRRKLLAFEREKSRDSCALDSGRNESLMRSASTAHSAGKDLAAFGDIFFKTVYVLIIYRVELFLAERAYLFTGRFFKYLFNRCFFFHDFKLL